MKLKGAHYSHVRIIDSTDTAVFEQVRELSPETFHDGATDILVSLPLERLRAGEHLLTVDVTAGDRTTTRSIRLTRQ